jgi:hypothetical protein
MSGHDEREKQAGMKLSREVSFVALGPLGIGYVV